jgi:hypothetical protein
LNKEAQKAFEQIKANVLDRSLHERTRTAFTKDFLPKIAPDFDWDNFYYFGSSYGLEELGSFLYLNNRLPTMAEAKKWYNEKVSSEKVLEDR